jgi:hypothetical protein
MSAVLESENLLASSLKRDQKVEPADPTNEKECQIAHEVDVDSTKSTECGSDDSEEERGEEECLWVLDWDDTLFPTFWLQQEDLLLQEGPENDDRMAQLKMVATSTAKLLEAAQRLGRVIIITNAQAGWIEFCCSRYMPDLLPLLKDIRTVSARSEFEQDGVMDPTDWKRRAFEREIRAFCEECIGAGCGNLQVLSVGDSMYEQLALFHTAREVPLFRPKSVKLMEHPTPAQLVKEHELLVESLGDLLEQQGDFDIEIAVGPAAGITKGPAAQ